MGPEIISAKELTQDDDLGFISQDKMITLRFPAEETGFSSALRVTKLRMRYGPAAVQALGGGARWIRASRDGAPTQIHVRSHGGPVELS